MNIESAITLLFALPHVGEKSAVIFSMLGVSFVVFVWAAFIRKPDEKHGRHHHRHHWRHPKQGADEESGRRRGFLSRFRRRRRHRKERPRNPTLAETGGLPSTRSEEPGPSRPV